MDLDSNAARHSLTVVHSMASWLPQTMAWLHTQVSSLPPHVHSHIVCDCTQNLDQYPVRNLTSADRDALPWIFLGDRIWQVRKWRQSRLLRQQIVRSHAGILHSHFGDRGWENIAHAKSAGLKHTVTFYGYDVSRLPRIDPGWRERYQALFESADLFLCEGPYLRNSLIELGCPPDKARVHHLGVNLENIKFLPRRWEPGEPFRVLIAGSFVEKKGIPYALEALGRIMDRTRLQVTIIGDSNQQERSKREKARILEVLRRTGLDRHTRMLGYQPYTVLINEAHQHHVFLSPSVVASDGDSEGGAPVTIIDAAASGMPVVSTRHCDIPEVIADGSSGLLADEKDVEMIAAKLEWLLDNPEHWEKIITQARKHIETEFNATIQGGRLAVHYGSLFTQS